MVSRTLYAVMGNFVSPVTTVNAKPSLTEAGVRYCAKVTGIYWLYTAQEWFQRASVSHLFFLAAWFS